MYDNNKFSNRVRTISPFSFIVATKSWMLLVALFFVFQSCKTKKENGLSGLNIDTSFEDLLNKKTKIANNDSAYKYIPLETNEQCYLGKITKICVHGDKIFLNDKTSKALFCFNTSGKFLFKINAVGKGPGEYLGIYDFDVNEENVILLDPNGYKLLMYDLDGRFVKEKKLRHTALRAVCIYKHSIYAYTVSTPRQDETLKKNWIVEYNFDFKPIRRVELPDLTHLSRHSRISNNFIKKGDDLLFTKSYDHTIYRLTNKGVQPYLIMNFIRIPEKTQRISQLFNDSQATFCTGKINAINDSMLFMQFGHNRKLYELVYNDKQNEMFVNGVESAYSYTGNKTNDMMFMTLSHIRHNANNKTYTLCEVAQLKNKRRVLRTKTKKTIENEKILKLFNEIDLLDRLQNPIVFCNTYMINND